MSCGLDSRFRVKPNGAGPYQDAHDTYNSEMILLVTQVCSVSHCHDGRTRTGQFTEVATAVGRCGRLDDDNAHIIVASTGRQIALTIRSFRPSQRIDASQLKTSSGFPRDAHGDVRRGRSPKVPSADDGSGARDTVLEDPPRLALLRRPKHQGNAQNEKPPTMAAALMNGPRWEYD